MTDVHDLEAGLAAIAACEDATPAWVGAALRAGGRPDVDVATVTAEPVGHGMIGDTFRLTLTYGRGEGPESVVLKLAAADAASRDTGFRRLLYQREVGFYNELVSTVGVRAPRPIFAALDPAGQAASLLLEDLGPATPGDQLRGCSVDQAALAMEQAAALHAPRWGDPELERLAWLNLGDANGAVFSRLVKRVGPAFAERFTGLVRADTIDVCEHLSVAVDAYYAQHRRPWTVQHADFRLDNILWNARGGDIPMALVDWQTVLLGPGTLDVSYFLGGSLSVDDRRRYERDLVRLYHEALCARGVHGYDWDDCWTDYRLFAYAGLLNTVVSAMIVRRDERGDRMFAAMATRHAAHALDLDTAGLLEA